MRTLGITLILCAVCAVGGAQPAVSFATSMARLQSEMDTATSNAWTNTAWPYVVPNPSGAGSWSQKAAAFPGYDHTGDGMLDDTYLCFLEAVLNGDARVVAAIGQAQVDAIIAAYNANRALVISREAYFDLQLHNTTRINLSYILSANNRPAWINRTRIYTGQNVELEICVDSGIFIVGTTCLGMDVDIPPMFTRDYDNDGDIDEGLLDGLSAGLGSDIADLLAAYLTIGDQEGVDYMQAVVYQLFYRGIAPNVMTVIMGLLKSNDLGDEPWVAPGLDLSLDDKAYTPPAAANVAIDVTYNPPFYIDLGDGNYVELIRVVATIYGESITSGILQTWLNWYSVGANGFTGFASLLADTGDLNGDCLTNFEQYDPVCDTFVTNATAVPTFGITTQPAAPTAPIDYGGTWAMSVAAAASPPNESAWEYLWYRGDTPGTLSPISGATSSSYTAPIDFYSLPGSPVSKYYQVRVRAYNSCDVLTTVLSNVIEIVGGNPPAITISPQPASLNRVDGQNGSMTVGATVSAGTLTYQWQRYVSGAWTDLSGKTGTTLSWTPALYADSGDYRCVVTNVIGANLPYSVNSNAATLNVAPPIVITDHPIGANLNLGQNHSMSVTATVAAGVLSYQWQLNSGLGFQNISGATGSTYDINGAQLSDGGAYRCVVTNTLAPHSPYSVTSNSAIVVVSSGEVFRVDKTATGAGTGLTWADAFTTIQPAINAAFAAGGGEVWVAGGTLASPVVYNEPRTELWGDPGYTGSLVMKDNVALYGGFQGWRGGAGIQETSRLQRNRNNWAAIDGSTSRAGSPAYHVVAFGKKTSATVGAVLDGFIIQGGNASGVAGNYHTWRGGGIYNWLSTPLISNCYIRNNTAAISGGGAANESNATFEANAVYTNCVISGNTAQRVSTENASPPNPARGGGGVFNNRCSPAFVHVTLLNNITGTAGALPLDPGPGYFPNYGLGSGAMYTWGDYEGTAAPTIVSSVAWGNTGTVGILSDESGESSTTITYSDIQGGVYPGTGNISADPLLDADGVPAAGSPILDVADPADATADDIIGTTRPQDTGFDMGAYEYLVALPPEISCLPLSIDLTVRTSFDSSVNSDDALAAYDAINSTIYNPPATLQLEDKTFSCADIGTSSILLTATDALGLQGSCTATVTVTESEPPVAACNPLTVYLNSSGSYTLTPADITSLSTGSTDNCAIDTAATTVTPDTFSCANLGAAVNVTVTVYDTVGNSDSCMAAVTALDTLAPTAVCNPITRSLDGSGAYTLTSGDITALSAGSSDNCALNDGATTASPDSFTCADLGANSVTVTVFDTSGNSSSCTATVTIQDTTAPVITVTGSTTMNLECNLGTYVEPGATATDNCSVGTPTPSGTVDTSTVGTYTITYNVTDGAGNSATPKTRTVNVFDGTPPIITLLGDPEVNVDMGDPYTDAGATALDVCEGNLTAAIVTVNPVNTNIPGTYLVTYNVTDTEGNVATQVVRTVNVIDTSTPVVTNVTVTTGWTVLVTFSMPMGTGVTDAYNYTVSGPGRGNLPYNPTSVVLDSGNTYLLTWTSAEMFNAADLTITVDASVQAANGNPMGTPNWGTHVGGSIGVAPTITACPADRNVNLGASCTATVPNLLAEFTATDNVTLPANLVKSQNPIAGNPLSPGITVVTLTVTDEAGNASTCETELNVADRTAPTITSCASNQTVSANASCQGVVPSFTGVTATDNCTAPGSLVITQSPLAGATVPLGNTTITITVTDEAGNATTCTATLTVNDTTPPVFTTPPSNQGANADGSCQATVPNFTVGVVATDNCTGSPILTQSPTAGSTVGVGPHTITVRATDSAGNFSTATATFTVSDTTAPVITTCAPNQTVSANASCQYAVPNFTTGVVATDNCTAAGSLIKTQAPTSGTMVGTGTHVITITVRDAAGNESACQATLTVNDTTAPVITTCASSQTLSANVNCQAAVPNMTGGVVATDNCTPSGSLTITQAPTADTIVGTGVTTVTITVRDASNNSATCSANLTVNDTTAPVITTCAPNQTIPAGASCQAAVPNVTGGVAATDNCTAAGSLTITQSPSAGTMVGAGTHTITITVRDAATNQASCTATLTVEDTTTPVITTCPSDETVSAGPTCSVNLPDFTGSVVASDNCTLAGNLLITQVPTAGTAVSTGDHLVTLYVEDAAGNETSCQLTYTVEDVTAPVITRNGTSPVTVQCGSTYVDAGATATDNCDGDLTTSISTVNPVNTALVGSYTVTYNVTDSAGNPATQRTRMVNVVDTTAPVIGTCPPDQNIAAGASCQAAVPDFSGGVVATDNCTPAGSLTISQSPLAGTMVSVGTHTITITVRDAANNAATCTPSLTVTDTTAPVITLLGTSPMSHTAGLPFTDPGVSIADNCDAGLTPVVGGDSINETTPAGTYQITYDVTDTAGNPALQVIRIVEVTDAPLPMITLNGDNPMTVNCPAAYTDPGATATEGDAPYEALTVTVTIPSALQQPVPPLGDYQVVYEAQSVRYPGASASATRTVYVVDTVNPVITVCASNQQISTGAGCLAAVPDFTGGVTATDNCSDPGSLVITQLPAAGTEVGPGDHTVTITVRDEADNTAACTATLTVVDSTNPQIISCASDQSAEVDGSCQVAVPNFTAEVVAADNCTDAGALVITQDPSAGATVDAGVHTVTITVEDEAGNSATCQALFTAEDVTAPVITTCAPNQSAITDANCQAAVPDFTAGVVASDNCTAPASLVITQSPAAGTLRGPGTYTVTITARDEANNPTTCVATFTVTDETDPVITSCAPNQTAYVGVDCQAAVPDFTANVVATDNCTLPENLVITQSPPAGNIRGVGSYTVTITVADGAGNTATCTATLTVEDNTDPTPAVYPIACNLSGAGDYSLTNDDLNLLAGTTTDNCGMDLSLTTAAPDTFDCADVGVNTVTLTLWDIHGNSVDASVSVTINDVTPPLITLNGGNPMSHTEGQPFTDPGTTAVDNCDVTVAVTVGGDVINETTPAGTYTITYDAVDSVGNPAAQVTRTVEVTDAPIPVLTVLGDDPVTLECPEVYADAGATAVEGDDPLADITAYIVTTIPAGLLAGEVGDYIVTYEVTSPAYGTSASGQRTVHIEDNSTPVITLTGEAALTVECGTAYTDAGATAADACDGTLTPDATGTVNTSVPGEYSITYTVSDGAGNAATPVIRTVTVADTLPPVITLLGDDPVQLDVGEAYIDAGATAADDCDGDLTTEIVVVNPVDTNTVGAYLVTYNVTDGEGNVAEEVTRLVKVGTVIDVVFDPDPTPAFLRLYKDADPATLTATYTGGTDVTGHRWFRNGSSVSPLQAPSVGVPVSLTVYPSSLNGTYTYELYVYDSYFPEPFVSAPAVVEVAAPLSVGTLEDVELTEGMLHNWSVSVTGGFDPLAYAWQHNLDGTKAFVNIMDGAFGAGSFSGADTDTLTINFTMAMAGQYQVVVTDDNGSSVIAGPADLTGKTGLPVSGALAMTLLVVATSLGGAMALRKRR